MTQVLQMTSPKQQFRYIWEGSFINYSQGGPDLTVAYKILSKMQDIHVSMRPSIYVNQLILAIETEKKDDMRLAMHVLKAFNLIDSISKEINTHRFT